jgi:hypothetical protein
MTGESKIMLVRAILAGVIAVLLLAEPSSAKYSGGAGEPNDPYRIATPNDLNDIGNHVEDFNKSFVLINDINLAEFTGTQFNVIGNGSDPFTGTFDGNNHVVSNFTYNHNSPLAVVRVGIFGFAGGEQVKIEDLILSNPYADVNATPFYSEVGALVGHFRDGIIKSCGVKNGKISSDHTAGGLVGNNFGTVINSYSNTTEVYGPVSGGGLIGENFGNLTNCYATGAAQAYHQAGGLVGYLMEGNIVNCYAAANISAEFFQGGLIGFFHNGTFLKCFWNNTTNPQIPGMGNEQPIPDPNIISIPECLMKKSGTFTDAGWDFVEVWDIGENQTYPFLRKYWPGDLNHDGIVNFHDYAIVALHWLGGEWPAGIE